MNLKSLETFIAVADAQSFTRAAKSLGMTQPAVSMQIRSLEEFLGVQLLERSERTIQLTPAGVLLYPKARALLKDFADLVDAVEEYRGLKRGILRIGASTVPGEALLPALMGIYQGDHPALEFQLAIHNTHQVIDLVKAKDVDLGVVGGVEEDPALVFTPWVEDRLVLIAAPARAEALGQEAALAGLVEERWLFREKGSGTRRFLEEGLAALGLDLNPRHIMEMGSQRAVISGVAAGLGLAFISRLAAAEALALGKVREVPLADLDGRRPLYLVRLKDKYISPFEASFFDFLMEQSQNLFKDLKL